MGRPALRHRTSGEHVCARCGPHRCRPLSASTIGELCALRWSAVSLTEGRETAGRRRAIRKTANGLVEGDLKTHQQRRVALDAEAAAPLKEHRERCLNRAEEAGEALLGY